MQREVLKNGQALSSEHGFSLVEVLIVAGIMGIMLVGLLAMVANSFQAENRLALNTSSRDFANEVREVVARSQKCGIVSLTPSLAVSDASWAASTYYDISSTGLASPYFNLRGGDVFDGKVKVLKIEIGPNYDKVTTASNYVAIGSTGPSDFANALTVRGSLRISIEGTGGGTMNYKAPIIIPIQLSLSSDRSQMIDCITAENAADIEALCMQMNGDWDQISLKCEVPCPPGTVDQEGECVSLTEEQTVRHCKPTENCGVPPEYIF